jgi:hypothetical protein
MIMPTVYSLAAGDVKIIATSDKIGLSVAQFPNGAFFLADVEGDDVIAFYDGIRAVIVRAGDTPAGYAARAERMLADLEA